MNNDDAMNYNEYYAQQVGGDWVRCHTLQVRVSSVGTALEVC